MNNNFICENMDKVVEAIVLHFLVCEKYEATTLQEKIRKDIVRNNDPNNENFLKPDIHGIVKDCLEINPDVGPNVLEEGPMIGTSTSLELWFMYHAYREEKQVDHEWKKYLSHRSGGKICSIVVNETELDITFKNLVTSFEGPGFSNWLQGRDEGFIPVVDDSDE